MSVRTMARVWADSQHSGTHLLMMLAIADFADDDGNAYPAVNTLAIKCRMKPRNATYILRALEESGELQVRLNEGPKGANRYRIVLEALGVQGVAPLHRVAALQASVATPAILGRDPLQPIAEEPSMNHQEPPDRARALRTGSRKAHAHRLSTCQAQAVIDVYHEVLPEMPKCRLHTQERIRAIQKAWTWVLTSTRDDGSRRAETEEQALEWFRAYFEHARGNDFLMNRLPRKGEHANWRCDFDFLLTDRGMKHVIEKTESSA